MGSPHVFLSGYGLYAGLSHCWLLWHPWVGQFIPGGDCPGWAVTWRGSSVPKKRRESWVHEESLQVVSGRTGDGVFLQGVGERGRQGRGWRETEADERKTGNQGRNGTMISTESPERRCGYNCWERQLCWTECGRAKSLGEREPGAGTRHPVGQKTAWVEAGTGGESGTRTLATINSLGDEDGFIILIPLPSAKTWGSHCPKSSQHLFLQSKETPLPPNSHFPTTADICISNRSYTMEVLCLFPLKKQTDWKCHVCRWTKSSTALTEHECFTHMHMH